MIRKTIRGLLYFAALLSLSITSCDMPLKNKNLASYKQIAIADHLKEQRVKDFFNGSIWQRPRLDKVNLYHQFNSPVTLKEYYYDVGFNDHEYYHAFALKGVYKDEYSHKLYWKVVWHVYVTHRAVPLIIFFPDATKNSLGPQFIWDVKLDDKGQIDPLSGQLFIKKTALINPA